MAHCWHYIYKEADSAEIAKSFYISERMVRRIINLFLISGHAASGASVGRTRTLTSLEETLVLYAIFENPGIYLDEVQRYLEEKVGVVISIHRICRNTHAVAGTDRKKDTTPSFVAV